MHVARHPPRALPRDKNYVREYCDLVTDPESRNRAIAEASVLISRLAGHLYLLPCERTLRDQQPLPLHYSTVRYGFHPQDFGVVD
jgi:hypothetical protein